MRGVRRPVPVGTHCIHFKLPLPSATRACESDCHSHRLSAARKKLLSQSWARCFFHGSGVNVQARAGLISGC
jgi:hypothetical protein